MASVYDLKPKFQNLLRPLCARMARAGITANQVTLSAAILSTALGAAIAVTMIIGVGIEARAEGYEVTRLVPGSAFHGVHGLGIDSQGRLFAGSVAGAALYEVDPGKGTAKIVVPTPEGMADDIAFAPDGTMAWTGFQIGRAHV